MNITDMINITNYVSVNTSLKNESGHTTDHAFDELLPTLVECFTIIFCGYLCGRFKVLSKPEMIGLNFFSTNFALPSLLFLNLATLNLTGVNWAFVGGITFGKFLVFVGVAVAIAFIVRPINLASIAIYSIFCTHVNDFGLAYPILQSVYEERHPAYPGYMYVIGLISLVVLNPIGFFLIEIEKATKDRADEGPMTSRRTTPLCLRFDRLKYIILPYLHVLRRVLTNPNVFMTVLGVIANLSFQGELPTTIKGVSKIFASTFQGSVLFLLGFQVAGASLSLSATNFLIPGILLAIKMLLSPLLTRGTVQLFCNGAEDSNDLADYGFLYGTVPTAPVVLLYASQFGMPTEMLATTLVMCTFLSGPIMYVSARMLAVQAYDVLAYLVQIRQTIWCLSTLSIVSCIWIAFLFIMRGRWRKAPHSITLALIASQALMSIGLFLWAWNGADSSEGWRLYFEIFTITGGQMASRFWTAVIAISLCLNVQNQCVNEKYTPYLLILGLVLPIITVVCLVVTTQFTEVIAYGHEAVPSFLFGENEACMAVVILSFCLVTTVGCLVVFFRIYGGLEVTLNTDNSSDIVNEEIGDKGLVNATVQDIEAANWPVKAIEPTCEIKIEDHDNPSIPKRNPKHLKEKSISKRALISDCQSTSDSGEYKDTTKVEIKEMQFLRHATLLIILSISMMVGLTTSIWKVLSDRQSGIFVALEFLDVILNYGQALFCLCIFGRDVNVVVVPIVNFVEKIRRNRRKDPVMSPLEELDEETQYVCFQFMIYHYQKCLETLPRDKVWKKTKHESVFWGWEMVDWLLDQGLSRSRKEATKQGNQLLRGKIIEAAGKIKQKPSHFQDGHYFYTLNTELGRF